MGFVGDFKFLGFLEVGCDGVMVFEAFFLGLGLVWLELVFLLFSRRFLVWGFKRGVFMLV